MSSRPQSGPREEQRDRPEVEEATAQDVARLGWLYVSRLVRAQRRYSLDCTCLSACLQPFEAPQRYFRGWLGSTSRPYHVVADP